MTVRLLQMLASLGGALIALAGTSCTALQPAAETPSEKADALLSGLIHANDPGLAVLVAQDGKILFEKGYGLADLEHHLPVTPQTIFRIASVTKQFTAAAILKLQEEGKLSIEDKLSKYIPDFPRGDEVTLRQLLTHTSGIHDCLPGPDFLLSSVTNATTTEAMIKAIEKDPYDFDPGAQWRYDNAGYLLLDYIVEKVSGQSYGDFLRDNFFQPLGMTNTGVYLPQLTLPHEALGYRLGTDGFTQTPNEEIWWGGAGSLYSTIEDLYRWSEGLFNGRVLDAASLMLAFTPVETKVNQDNHRDTGYGFGWFIRNYRGLPEISHGGGVDGFWSMLLRVPDEKFSVAILANAQPGRKIVDPNDLAHQLENIFLADKLAPPPIINPNVSSKSYDVLTGRYDITPGQVFLSSKEVILTISRQDTHLFAQAASGTQVELFPESDTEFFAKFDDARFAFVTFVKDSSGKAVKLILHEDGLDLLAPRVKDISETKLNPAGS